MDASSGPPAGAKFVNGFSKVSATIFTVVHVKTLSFPFSPFGPGGQSHFSCRLILPRSLSVYIKSKCNCIR